MIRLLPPFRAATPADAAAMAEFVNMAGEGLPLYLWTRWAGPGEDPWKVGRSRARRETGSFSYRNAIMLESDGEVAGCLIGYRLSDQPEPIAEDMPPMFVPLQELENLAPGAWNVNVLAILPSHRGKGHGTRLLALAEKAAAETDSRALSIIVSDANTGARRLYERVGYQQVAERPMVKDEWANPGRSWVLLVKPSLRQAACG